MLISSWLSSFASTLQRRSRTTTRRTRKPAASQHVALESLEARTLLSATTPVLVGNDVEFNGDAAADTVSFSVNAAGYLQHNLPVSAGFNSNIDLDSATAGVQSRLVSDITSLTYDDAGLNDTVNFSGANAFSFSSPGFTSVSVAALTINVNSNAAIDTIGTGSISLEAARNIVVSPASRLTTVDGGITLNANETGTAAGLFDGIYVQGSTVETTGRGNVLLSGRGGYQSSSAGAAILSRRAGTSVVTSTMLGSEAGTITINGIGGDESTSDQNFGVWMGTSSLITSYDGDIEINGTQGTTSAAGGAGVNISDKEQPGSHIRSLGVGADAANITIYGVGKAIGFVMSGANRVGVVDVTSIAGNISITGTGVSQGVLVRGEGVIQVDTGTMKITGISSSPTAVTGLFANSGIRLGDAGNGYFRSTGSGDIYLSGYGITAGQLDLRAGGVGGPAATGNIFLNADTIAVGGSSIQSAGALTIAPNSSSTSIGLGGAGGSLGDGPGTLNLNDTELTKLADGFSSITIGDPAAGTGAVNINTATFRDPVTIAGGHYQRQQLLVRPHNGYHRTIGNFGWQRLARRNSISGGNPHC